MALLRELFDRPQSRKDFCDQNCCTPDEGDKNVCDTLCQGDFTPPLNCLRWSSTSTTRVSWLQLTSEHILGSLVAEDVLYELRARKKDLELKRFQPVFSGVIFFWFSIFTTVMLIICEKCIFKSLFLVIANLLQAQLVFFTRKKSDISCYIKACFSILGGVFL